MHRILDENKKIVFNIMFFTEIFQRKDHDQDNLIKIEMVDVRIHSNKIY